MGISERTIAEFIIDQANSSQSSKAFTKVRVRDPQLQINYGIRIPINSSNLDNEQAPALQPAGSDSHGHAGESGKNDVEHHPADAAGERAQGPRPLEAHCRPQVPRTGHARHQVSRIFDSLSVRPASMTPPCFQCIQLPAVWLEAPLMVCRDQAKQLEEELQAAARQAAQAAGREQSGASSPESYRELREERREERRNGDDRRGRDRHSERSRCVHCPSLGPYIS